MESGRIAGAEENPESFSIELPAGWLGKAHAMWTATNAGAGDWLLFTDADVLFKPDLRRALAYAEAERADHWCCFRR